MLRTADFRVLLCGVCALEQRAVCICGRVGTELAEGVYAGFS